MSVMIPAWIDGQLVPQEKLAVHLQGLKHKAVSVFVMRDGLTLIQRRALSKYHTPGLWANSCCTHPNWDETPEACAHRRLREELGLEDCVLTARGQYEYRAEVGRGMIEHELVDVFTAELPASQSPQSDPEEVAEVTWVSLDELDTKIKAKPNNFTPWLKIYMSEFRERIFGTPSCA